MAGLSQAPTIPAMVLLRHARPLIEEGVCYGATDMDADAAATLAAAQQMAPLLAPQAQLWSSPLRRCTQLTQALCALRPDLKPCTDNRLAEMDFGRWEGWRWADIPGRNWTPGPRDSGSGGLAGGRAWQS